MGEARVEASSTSQAEFMSAVSHARERVRLALARPGDLLRELAEAIAAVVEAPAMVALLDGGRLVRRAVTEGAPLPAGTLVATTGTVCGEAVSGRRPVRIDDVDLIPPAIGDGGYPDACCPGGRSLLSVPVLHGPHVVGVISATAPTPEWFDAMDERAVALVAQVAVLFFRASSEVVVLAPCVAAAATFIAAMVTDMVAVIAPPPGRLPADRRPAPVRRDVSNGVAGRRPARLGGDKP